MIRDLPDTTTGKINRELSDMRARGGAVTLGRVLTLVISTESADFETAVAAANDASSEHPCRVLVVRTDTKKGPARLDAQIRVGGDAGASDVITLVPQGEMSRHPASVVLPFLLPDAPVVTWWPDEAPEVPIEDQLGKIAQRRITDAASAKNPVAVLTKRAAGYAPGDTDLAWTRVTSWRGLLAAALDQPPYERITRAVVEGEGSSASTELMAAWLRRALKADVTRQTSEGPGITRVTLERRSGPVTLARPDGKVAVLSQAGQPDRRVALARRALNECLAEELRRLDPDEMYGEALTRGLTGGSSRARKRAAAS